MKIVSYTDAKGRMWATRLPDDVSDEDAPMGIPLGPPSLESLGLPEAVEVRLHNQLFSRRIFTAQEAKHRAGEVIAALQAALVVDATIIIGLYINGKKEE